MHEDEEYHCILRSTVSEFTYLFGCVVALIRGRRMTNTLKNEK